MKNSACCNNSEGCKGMPHYNAEKECNSFIMHFTATVMMPADFDYNRPTQISMSLSTENLTVYKEIVEHNIENRDRKKSTSKYNRYNQYKSNVKQCNNYIVNEIGEVRICGTLIYRIAINGIQSDSLIIDKSIQDIVNVDGNVWSSGDGYIQVSDGCNSYITMGYIPPDKDIDMTSLKVCLKSLKLDSVYKERCSSDLKFMLKGTVLIKCYI